MDKETILKKAIEKATKNGYSICGEKGCDCFPKGYKWSDTMIEGGWDNPPFYYQVIFSHDFAKAFWGEEDCGFSGCPFCEYPGYYEIANWQYHLQQMVLEEDPIDYLSKFI